MKTIAVSGLHRGDNPQPGPSVIRSIRRRYPDARIVGLSYDPFESGLYATGPDAIDASYLMPFPQKGPDELLARLDEIDRAQSLDAIIPCLDAEVPNYIELADKLAARLIKVPLVTQKSFDRRDKKNLNKLGKQAKVRVPKTEVVNDARDAVDVSIDMGFPVYIKGKMYGAAQANSSADVVPLFNSLVATWGGPVIIQASVQREDEYDVVGIGDGKGGVIASCAIRKVLLTPAGKAFGGIVIDNPELQASVNRIIKTLKWYGPFELEFVKDEDGHQLIEMNPRFPAWCDFPSQVGCNLPALLVEMMLGMELTPIKQIEAGKLFIRHCIDVAGDISQMADLIGHGVTGANKCILPR